MTVYFASASAHKLAELSRILELKHIRWALKTPEERGIRFDPVEDGASFVENSLKKARELWEIVRSPVLADDSGLCVDALDDRPGIFSARYGAKNGVKLPSSEQNALLLEEIGDNPLRSARFVCAMTLFFDPNRFFVAQETLEGTICREPSGDAGFGYDPLLFLPQYGCTVAALDVDEKNRISHRAKAAHAILALADHGAS